MLALKNGCLCKVLKMIETSLNNFNTERAVNKVMPLLGHKKSFPRFSGR